MSKRSSPFSWFLTLALLVFMTMVLAGAPRAAAVTPETGAPPDSALTHLNAEVLQSAGDGEIDYVGTDPASQNGAILVKVLNYEASGTGTATAQIKVRNVTSLWYKLYVESVGDVDFNFTPTVLEDEQGKFLYLPPEGASDFAYPTLEQTVTFNEPNAGLFFTADRTVESGLGALFLQQLEIVSRAGTGIPTLPHDEAGAMVEVVKASTQGLDPFIDAATAIHDGDVSGTIGAVSELGRTPESIAGLQLAFAEIGEAVSESQIKNATTLLSIFSLTWYIAEFIGESLGFSGGDSGAVKAFDFDTGPTVDAQMTVTGGGSPAPVQVSYDAGDSFASEGISSYVWDFGDGSPQGSGESVQQTYDQSGTYDVTLTVTDTEGNTDQVTQTVQVFAPSLVVDRQTLYEFEFEAEDSDDITGYTWEFGDGSTASGRTPVHTYDSRGEYDVTLTLTLNNSETTQVTRTVYAGPQPVYVGGTLESDRIWPASHGPYVISYRLSVPENTKLTIDPGAVVKLQEGPENGTTRLVVNGTLDATGTAADSVVFTSIKDDSHGGDTNGDGDASAPAPGDWGLMLFYQGSTATLDHAVVRYGGHRVDQMIYVSNSSTMITNSTIASSQGVGIDILDGAPNLGTAQDPGRNIFRYNSDYAVKNNSSETIQAVGNYWDATDPDVIDNRIYDDDEDSGSGPVVFEPFLTEPPEEGVPAPPSDLAAAAGDGQVDLSWTANSEGDLAGYNIYRATTSFSDVNEATKINSDLVTSPSYADNGVTGGTTYYYRATAVDADGNESGLSNEAVATPSGQAVSFVNPVENAAITQAYANHSDVNGDGTDEYHAGIDIDSATEDCSTVDCPIRAAAPGTVTVLPQSNGNHDMGNVVIIEHSSMGLYTLYAHLSSFSVSDGASVSAGEEIGIMGETGFSTDAHLHFEVKDRGVLGAGRNNDEGPWAYTPSGNAPPPSTTNKPGHPNWFGYHDPNLFLNNEVETLANPIPVEVVNTPLEVRDYPSTDSNLSLVLTSIASRSDGNSPAFVAVRKVGSEWYQIHLANDPPDESVTEGWSATGWIAGTLDGTTSAQPNESLPQVEVVPESARMYAQQSTSSSTLSFAYGGNLNRRQRFVAFESTPEWHRVYLSQKSEENEGWIFRGDVSEVPVAAESATVNADGPVDFGNTDTDVTFSGVEGSGEVTVDKYSSGPAGTEGIDKDNVSVQRVVIEADGSLSFGSGTEVRFAISGFDGIYNPSDVTIYKRPGPGTGTFSPLATSVDDGGTPGDISDDEVYAATGSFSEFVLASDSEPLPVELTSFDAVAKEQSITLTWTTASETNNAGFHIERATEKQASFKEIGFVEGAGTTTERRDYRFEDANLPFEASDITYRLRQVDSDGTFKYSNEIEVAPGTPDQLELHGNFPNPFADRTKIRYELPRSTDAQLIVYNALGQQVAVLVDGRKEVGRHETTFASQDLPSGVYFLRLRAGGKSTTRKITVVR